MAPIDVHFGWFKGKSNANPSSVQIPQSDMEIGWTGDKHGEAKVFRGGTEQASFPLKNPGESASFSVTVRVPHPDQTYPATRVQREIKITRTKE